VGDILERLFLRPQTITQSSASHFSAATKEAFAVCDLREHTGELVRNAENGGYSVVSKHGKHTIEYWTLGNSVIRVCY
jgi:hypothetical protein